MWETCKAWLAQYNLWDDRAALWLLSRMLFPQNTQISFHKDSVQQIVVYRIGNIGDTVVAIPALSALRNAFPEARITLLTSAGNTNLPGAGDVLSAFPKLIDRVIAYRPAELKTLNALQNLKAQLTQDGPIDIWLSLPVSLQTVIRGFREILLAKWLGCRAAFGFTLLLPEVFKTEYTRNNPIPKTSDWLLSIVQQAFHLPPKAPDCRAYFRSPSPQALERLGLSRERPILLVNAGAKLAIKRWPETSFHQTLSSLLKKLPVVQVVLLGSQEEHEANARIAQNLSGVILNVAGQLSIAETWSLMNQATALLSNDTGAMHMAGLLGKAGFTPMGGQYPAPLWHPPGSSMKLFSHNVPCAPCFKDNCPLPRQTCLMDISPTSLIDALYEHLK